MNPNFLDFEQPIAELEDKLRELTTAGRDNAIDVDDEVGKLRSKLRSKTAEIFRDLSPWQITQLSRHPGRPYTHDYVAVICELVNSHLACFHPPGGLHPASCHGVQREQPLHVPGHGHQAPLASNAIETA